MLTVLPVSEWVSLAPHVQAHVTSLGEGKRGERLR